VDVTGRVLYKNKPVLGGQVQFAAVDGGFSSNGIIDPNGNYKITAPVGDVKITVDNRMLGGRGAMSREAARHGAGRPDAGAPTPVKGTYMEIPHRYYLIDTTDLTYTVTDGPQSHDIELKD
jgi:hypothetical protein